MYEKYWAQAWILAASGDVAGVLIDWSSDPRAPYVG
jgi:hypothetical protein